MHLHKCNCTRRLRSLELRALGHQKASRLKRLLWKQHSVRAENGMDSASYKSTVRVITSCNSCTCHQAGKAHTSNQISCNLPFCKHSSSSNPYTWNNNCIARSCNRICNLHTFLK